MNSLELNTNRFFSRIVYAIKTAFWRDVRVVDGAILERLCTETYRGFESPSLRFLFESFGLDVQSVFSDVAWGFETERAVR